MIVEAISPNNTRKLSNSGLNNSKIMSLDHSQQSSESSIIDLNKRTKINKQMDLNTFFTKKRHFFIMTDGGKPIFSRYGDEVENCGILATFSAMITKFTFFNNSGGSPEKLQ